MTIFIKNDIAMPPLSSADVLRYASAPQNEQISLPECPGVTPLVCYTELPLGIFGDVCDFGYFKVTSKNLAKNLSGCDRVLVFAATVGICFDREIAKFSSLSPSRALLASAMGTERVEALCDAFVKGYEEENGVALKPRFSPGYGDLPLDVQRDIFALLNPVKNIGVSLGESLLMTPAKSVTAFAGIK